MTIFEKGNYKTVPSEFRTFGIASLEELSKFQEKFEMFGTDKTINAIRDAIIANYLDFDLLNFDKHGFDAVQVICNLWFMVKTQHLANFCIVSLSIEKKAVVLRSL